MKKLFLVTLLTFLTNSSVFANSIDKTGKFYLKGIIGSSRINTIQENENIKQKSENSPVVGFGTGYYLTDSIRTELTFDHTALNFKNPEQVSDSRNMNFNLRKMYINSVMLNAYVDILKFDNFSIFGGAGFGWAQINEEIAWIYPIGNQNVKGNTVKKTANNFAYSLSLGAAMEIKDGVNVEVAYSFRDFGKTTRAQRPNMSVTLPSKKVTRQDVALSLGIRMSV